MNEFMEFAELPGALALVFLLAMVLVWSCCKRKRK